MHFSSAGDLSSWNVWGTIKFILYIALIYLYYKYHMYRAWLQGGRVWVEKQIPTFKRLLWELKLVIHIMFLTLCLAHDQRSKNVPLFFFFFKSLMRKVYMTICYLLSDFWNSVVHNSFLSILLWAPSSIPCPRLPSDSHHQALPSA